MPTAQKEARVAQLKTDLEAAGAIYLTEMSGLDVQTMYELRTRLLEAGARLQIAKNRLMKLAMTGTEAEGLTQFLTGPTGILFCGEDPVSPAKVIVDFGKAHEFIGIKAAVVEGRVYDREQAQKFATLPSSDQLRGMVVSGFAGPLNCLVGVLNAVVSELVLTLQAVAEKRQEQGA